MGLPADVLAGDLQPTHVGVSRPCYFRAASPDVGEVGDLRPISLTSQKWALSTNGVISGDISRRIRWAFCDRKYLRSTSSEDAAVGVGIYLPTYNWADAGT